MADFNAVSALGTGTGNQIMIKLESLDTGQTSPEYYITSPLSVDGNIIPVNLNTRLVNELGKNLLKASAEGDIDEIRRLLTKGAPFTADWLGTSPLHLAAQGNHLGICELLLRAGISPNARTKVDRTPLHMAACEGHMDIVELLLGADADIDCTDLLGMTPLHWAVQNGHGDIVYILLKSSARIDIANKFGLKAADVADQICRSDICRLLEDRREVLHHEDPTAAAENLAIEMAAQDEKKKARQSKKCAQTRAPPRRMAQDAVTAEEAKKTHVAIGDDVKLNSSDASQNDNSVSDSMKILQEHGITMLPNDDDNNILSTVMETGHSVVLTDVGKQVLDSVKASEEAAQLATRNTIQANSNYITVTADELLMLAANASIKKKQAQIVRKVNGKYVPKTIKRIVMTKSKLQPISPIPNLIVKQKPMFQPIQPAPPPFVPPANHAQIVLLAKQLEEAKRTIEEYKHKLMQKEAEADRYKQQLSMLGYS